MCFSANASFGAGIVLAAIGIASVKKAQTPSQIFFGCIPLIFCVQQITEGFVWLSLSNPAYASLKQVATYNFLFFAQVVWPLWIPLSILMLEPKMRQKKAGKIFVGIGALVSIYFAYCLLTFPVEATIAGHHISYQQDFPSGIAFYCGAIYIVATIVPAFLSRIRRMWILGTTILISYIITRIFYTDNIVSVWCFFATLISLVVFAILHHLNHSQRLSPKLSEEFPDSPASL